MIIGANLTNFRSANLSGVGYFFKRLMVELDTIEHPHKFVFFVTGEYDHSSVFSIPINSQYEIVKLPIFGNKLSRILYEQTRFIKKLNGIDVLYSPTNAVPLLTPRKIKIVTTIHDLIPFIDSVKYGFIQRNYIKYITKQSAKKSDLVITVSENSKSDLIKHLGIKSAKVRIVNNFIPTSEILGSFPDNNLDSPYFVTISNIQPGKNLETTLKAFKIFKEKSQYEKFRFIVIGKNGWNYKSVHKCVEDMDLTDSVIFTGYLDDNTKYSILKEAKALIYCSLYEGFGIPPLEAMYFHVPSVVSNTSSLPEVVGEAGLKVSPYSETEIAEAMYAILSDEIRNNLIAKMDKQTQLFDPKVQTSRFLEILTTWES